MKNTHFWLKFTSLFILTLVVCALGVTFVFSNFYTDKENEMTLVRLEEKSKVLGQNLEFRIKSLAIELAHWQEGKPSSLFTAIAVVDTDKDEMFVNVPSLTLPLERIRQASYRLVDQNPIAFYKAPALNQGQRGVALLINMSKLTDKEFKKNEIRIGILNKKSIRRVGSLLSSVLVSQAFILDGNRNYLYFHSNPQYSGRILSQKAPYNNLKRAQPSGWLKNLEKSNVLSIGVPIAGMDAYLVMNQKAAPAASYFEALFVEVALMILAVGFVMQLLMFLFLNPLLEAYQYLAQLFGQYADQQIFPVPEYSKNNPYVQAVQPTLRKIFWTHRADRLKNQEVKEAKKEFNTFFALTEHLSQQIAIKYPDIHVRLQCDADISLSSGSGWLEQALFELLKNSVDSMDCKGGIDIHSYKENELFYCKIRDYGRGMSQDALKRAHQAYYSSKEESKGFGLTLGMSALSRLGGKLYLSNADDEQGGLIAYVVLPLDRTQETGLKEETFSEESNLRT